MLETAILKVYSTEALWMIVNDAFQIHGGAAYFTDRPLERMLRDARINQIGEGANEVLMSFIALTGMRGPGLRLKALQDGLSRPWSMIGPASRFAAERCRALFLSPSVPVQSSWLFGYAGRVERLIRRLGNAVHRVLMRYREDVLDRQLVQECIAEAVMEIYAAACVLSRLDREDPRLPQVGTGFLFLEQSTQRARAWLKRVRTAEDPDVASVARSLNSR
jgi:hypothetical protein